MFELTEKCFVIAEAGTCHATSDKKHRLDLAMNYVFAAYLEGADAVKFQMFDDTDLFCSYLGDGQRKPRWNDSILGIGDWRQVKEFTEACGMVFLASVFQYSMVEALKDLEVDATKVASRAAESFPYNNATGTLLVSMGMKYRKGLTDAIYLECESLYPSTKCWSGEHKGFSDHSGSPWRAIDAISRGCKLIEVHFYVDPLDAGPDLLASLNLDELRLVCEARDAFAELRSNE